ncbi:hypothetical protein M406DRAFT_289377 [Cryphonectria parasitica EP155]|uniref:SYO1-like TPR repeats domain-containing protein n=1 Tax=Cryphonectria parasitica (strain ATCC 38755 / EP155) TaxID=660469 RepID=A0A9P5CSE1_CRYP1|nr:uncharacterized protein M406DRAFT_289377 [Cryphonectria parasitica EP155]KAF3768050.1 hypothetical protein M406DRAFT_289377 [Cryphonectria parasitica EP155]
MGKSRRNKANGHRADPMAIKAVKPPTDPELAALREKQILPVIKDLRSSDLKARGSAASAVANIVQDEKCRKLLLREQIVHIILTETLTDASLDSRAAGWEILRVIVSEEESDFCVHLFRLDVLTALEHAIKNVIQTISDQSFSKAAKAQQQVTWNITTALLSLVGALATARDEIAEAIVSNSQIIPFLCFVVNQSFTPPEILNETMSCLMTLSEDNLKASQAILADQSNCFRTLTKYKELGDSKAVYASGVLHNIYSALEWHDGSPGQDGATDAKVIPSLCRVLEKTKQDPKTYQIGGVEIEAVTQALEILASIATDLQASITKGNKTTAEWNGFEDDTAMAGADGEDEAMKQGSDEDDEIGDGAEEDGADEDDVSMDEDEILADMDLVTGPDSDAEDDAGLEDLPSLREFIQKATPQLIRLANFAPASDEAVAVQSEALSALNNIAWTMSCFDYSESGNAGLLKAWSPVAKRLWSKVIAPVLATDTADVSLASLVTSVAWAVSRTLKGSTPLVGNEQQKFISLYKASKGQQEEQEEVEDPFQALGVKCIGVLGQLAQDPAPIDLNREVGIFLLTVLDALPETSPADTVEALNQMMDIYGDESFPCDKAVFWKDSFLQHLEKIVPKVKTMVKSIDKRGATSELRVRADEAVLNLTRFIAYKKKHPPRP